MIMVIYLQSQINKYKSKIVIPRVSINKNAQGAPLRPIDKI